jgi:hypothetical protein
MMELTRPSDRTYQETVVEGECHSSSDAPNSQSTALSARTLYCKVTPIEVENEVRIGSAATSRHQARCDLHPALDTERHNGFRCTARPGRPARSGRVPRFLGFLVWALSAVLPLDGVDEKGLRNARADRPGH